jgi:exodeoxyribonuclease V alpha subunit
MNRRTNKASSADANATLDLFSAADADTGAPARAEQIRNAATHTLADVSGLLTCWAERGWLRPLDRAFAGFLRGEAPDAHPLLLLAAALASHQLGRGHVCLDLAATLADARFALSLPPEGDDGVALPALPDELLAGVTLADWQAALAHPLLVGGGVGNTPLVCVGTRLYLRRYWQYECDVRAGIEARLGASDALQAALVAEPLRHTLTALFPAAAGVAAGVDWQKLACALAARSAFSIVTGGPGTGKTTTVVKLLALLQSLALHRGADSRPLRIRLAAPTGKAAARLNESIAGAVARLPLDALPDGERVRDAIPTEVSTLHRLLGSRPDTRHFRHDARNPLPLDVLVVDEASMVDLEMMAALLAALPPAARLVLLGDKDQLASVEAGAVLGELCQRARAAHYTPATRDWLASVTGAAIDADLVDTAGEALDQAIAMLRVSHRFTAASGIGRLAEAVNAGDTATMHALWPQGYADLARVKLAGSDDGSFRTLMIDGGVANFPAQGQGRGSGDDVLPPPVGYRHYLLAVRDGRPPADAAPAAFDGWARAVLAAHGRFQVLCALRRGPFGVDGLNLRIARLLGEAGLIPATQGWYPGRPVLVTRNDYGLGLMNGDIGITLALPRAGSAPGAPVQWGLRVAFPAGDGTHGIKWVLPSRLQAVETVFAMTVHKSQGSEFVHAALVLPESLSPILTRELVYTGITRARHWLTLATAGGDRVLDEAAGRRVLRASGLLAR